MARCGDRVPRWPRTGWVHTGGLVPWGPAGPAPGRDFPRGCTVELFGVLCAPQVMHSASGVCPLPHPSVGSRGHGWAGHPHVPHPEHPEPPVTGRHWGPAPSLHPGVGVPAASPLPRPFTAPICFSFGNCSGSPAHPKLLKDLGTEPGGTAGHPCLDLPGDHIQGDSGRSPICPQHPCVPPRRVLPVSVSPGFVRWPLTLIPKYPLLQGFSGVVLALIHHGPSGDICRAQHRDPHP